MAEQARVYLVDDDDDVRDAVSFLLRSEGLAVDAFATPDALLAAVAPDSAGCLVLDVRLPGMDGLELQGALRARGVHMPIIFITGHGDIPMAVRAVNAGAMDFLEKPFRDQHLLNQIHKALAADAAARNEDARRLDVERRLQSLTPREREVMERMLEGKLNKVIAWELDVSIRTVEVHRARVLEKLNARNSSEMVRAVLSTEAYRSWLL
ncbi:MAG: response regulator transcription factor [Ectothiorhodospiraceae bacterium]|nr:response regulator transcription factor [Ectothiorhodospiraceae bacterium]MCH8502809.1 response regulator [Ectothiorhodospiraceae bacterium]